MIGRNRKEKPRPTRHSNPNPPTKNKIMKKISSLTLCAMILTLSSGAVRAQTPLLGWNMDNAAGSGATLTVAPSYIDGSMTGGVFLQGNANNTITTPAGSGLTGGAGDLGVVQSSAYNVNSSALVAGVGNLSSLSAFTLTLWVNLGGNFSAAPGSINSRIFDVNTAVNGDGNELFFGINNWTNLQFGVNNGANTGVIFGNGVQGNSAGGFSLFGNSISTMTNQWIFLAASYTTLNNGTVSLYEGSASVAASLMGSLTNVGTISWSATTNFFMLANRNTGSPNRGLPGTVDDVNLYSGAGDLAFINGIQAVPEPATLTIAGLGAASLLIMIRRRQICN
jgi:hypothetical protein